MLPTGIFVLINTNLFFHVQLDRVVDIRLLNLEQVFNTSFSLIIGQTFPVIKTLNGSKWR